MWEFQINYEKLIFFFYLGKSHNSDYLEVSKPYFLWGPSINYLYTHPQQLENKLAARNCALWAECEYLPPEIIVIKQFIPCQRDNLQFKGLEKSYRLISPINTGHPIDITCKYIWDEQIQVVIGG